MSARLLLVTRSGYQLDRQPARRYRGSVESYLIKRLDNRTRIVYTKEVNEKVSKVTVWLDDELNNLLSLLSDRTLIRKDVLIRMAIRPWLKEELGLTKKGKPVD